MIYFIQDSGTLLIKIGFTDGYPANRLLALQTGNPSGLVLLKTTEGAKSDEAELHRRFADARERGEWFRPTPELFRFMIGDPPPVEWDVENVAEMLELYCEYVKGGNQNHDGCDTVKYPLMAAFNCDEGWLEYVTGQPSGGEPGMVNGTRCMVADDVWPPPTASAGGLYSESTAAR